MTWQDYYRRKDVLNAALTLARRRPERPLQLSEIPGAEAIFDTETELLRALHAQWSQTLTGHLRAALSPTPTDQLDAVIAAWRGAAEANPTLLAVLDAALSRTPTALHDMHRIDLHMLAVAAELAEPGASVDEATRLGATIVTLAKNQLEPSTRRKPACQLRRLLAPAS